jgi:hypothetical protein
VPSTTNEDFMLVTSRFGVINSGFPMRDPWSNPSNCRGCEYPHKRFRYDPRTSAAPPNQPAFVRSRHKPIP